MITEDKWIITYKDIAGPKLTITKDRVELKFPNYFRLYRIRRYINLTHTILKDIYSEDMKSMRGLFKIEEGGKLSITMMNDSKTISKFYIEDKLCPLCNNERYIYI